MINNADIVLRAISIHALLAESDLGLKACKAPLANFNPRSPCGERLHLSRGTSVGKIDFNPRSPCGERPPLWQPVECVCHNFNPRSPCGERLILNVARSKSIEFQSTLSLRRATDESSPWS